MDRQVNWTVAALSDLEAALNILSVIRPIMRRR